MLSQNTSLARSCIECGQPESVSGYVVVCTSCRPPMIGEPCQPGETCTCVWCGYTSTRGEHEWVSEEDGPRGWECANESACRMRLGLESEAIS